MPITGLYYRIAACFKCVAKERSNDFFVFNEKDRLASKRKSVNFDRFGYGHRLFEHSRQKNLESRTDSNLAHDSDAAAALLYDSVNRRKSKTRSLPNFFCREERFENMLPIHFTDSRAGVRNDKLHIGSRQQPRKRLCVSRIDKSVACSYREVPSLRHRISSVHSQIHDDLRKLSAVDLHAANGRVKVRLQFDVLSYEPGQHLRCVENDFI